MFRVLILAGAAAALAGCSGAERADPEPAQPAPTGTAATVSGSATSSATASASGTQAAARFEGTVSGNATATHSFTARQGQTITVTREGTATMPYFNVMPPGGQPGDQLFVGMMEDGASWTGTAPATGTYTVQLYLRGAAKDEGRSAPYALTITVR